MEKRAEKIDTHAAESVQRRQKREKEKEVERAQGITKRRNGD